MGFFGTILTFPERLNLQARHQGIRVSNRLVTSARLDAAATFNQLDSRVSGLSAAEVEDRLESYGRNVLLREKKLTFFDRLWDNVKNPLVLLLAMLAVVSFLTGDIRATVLIAAMVLLGIVLRFIQETRADHAAEALQAMVSTTATVVREGVKQEVPLGDLVPGDLVLLSAGDMVPADLRLISAKDLFLNQAALTGEALPVEKTAAAVESTGQNPLELTCLCFQGSNVESGTGQGIIVTTGARTYFGSLTAASTSSPG
jgi:Mg2+-importing ATPase